MSSQADEVDTSAEDFQSARNQAEVSSSGSAASESGKEKAADLGADAYPHFTLPLSGILPTLKEKRYYGDFSNPRWEERACSHQSRL